MAEVDIEMRVNVVGVPKAIVHETVGDINAADFAAVRLIREHGTIALDRLVAKCSS